MSGSSGSSGGHRANNNRNVRGRLYQAPAPPALPALPPAAPPLVVGGVAPEIAAPAAPEIAAPAAPELLPLFPMGDPVPLLQAGAAPEIAAPELLVLFPVGDHVPLLQAGAAPEIPALELLPLFPVGDPVPLLQAPDVFFPLQVHPPQALLHLPVPNLYDIPFHQGPINFDDLPLDPPPPILPVPENPPPPSVYYVIPDFPQYPLGGDQDYLHLFTKLLSQSDINGEIKITGQNLPFFRDGVKVRLCSLERTCKVRLSLLSGDILISDDPVNLRIGNMGHDVSLLWHQLLGENAALLFVGQQVFGWFRWIEVAGPNEQNELTAGPNVQNEPNFTLHVVIQIQVQVQLP